MYSRKNSIFGNKSRKNLKKMQKKRIPGFFPENASLKIKVKN